MKVVTDSGILNNNLKLVHVLALPPGEIAYLHIAVFLIRVKLFLPPASEGSRVMRTHRRDRCIWVPRWIGELRIITLQENE